MATEERTTGDSVTDALLARVISGAPKTSYFWLISVLERLMPSAAPLGALGPLRDETVRIRHDPSMVFHTRDIASATRLSVPSDPADSLSPPRPLIEVTASFLGLFGTVSPLPSYFAEEVLHEQDARSIRDFLDIFHHRLYSLLYRQWAKYHISAEFTSDLGDIWSKRMLALLGYDTFENKPNLSIPLWRLLRLAPILAHRSRPVRNIEIALADALRPHVPNIKIGVQQFVGRWVEIEVPDRLKLGVVNTHLGINAVVGMKIFDKSGKIRIVISPLTRANFRRFMPDGDLFPMVRDVVGMLSRDDLDYDLELVLGQGAAPTIRLSSASTEASTLGVDSWLGGRSGDETRVLVDAANVPKQSQSSEGGGSSSEDDHALEFEAGH